ncbi:hypothetical protein B2J86_15575 [Acidovorax sp. SRB_14]|uniref:hypothetical protein n=1 Tax=Acidovorax sp. SRB_14 TaxID=1962699 RepID=UPI001563BD19|nr:hypothetical protein [Acidovorax sp. SRB_14]NMM82331.1 hypothetical protein [Acidovorax sp. SRB_14]
MRAPLPFFPPRRLAGLALLVPWLALAQSLPTHALADAANPAAPTAPINYRGISPLRVQAQDSAPQAWRAANEAVGAFPRGHADILVWEATQAAAGAPPMHPQHAGERQP